MLNLSHSIGYVVSPSLPIPSATSCSKSFTHVTLVNDLQTQAFGLTKAKHLRTSAYICLASEREQHPPSKEVRFSTNFVRMAFDSMENLG